MIKKLSVVLALAFSTFGGSPTLASDVSVGIKQVNMSPCCGLIGPDHYLRRRICMCADRRLCGRWHKEWEQCSCSACNRHTCIPGPMFKGVVPIYGRHALQ